jgi:hypothetical protein
MRILCRRCGDEAQHECSPSKRLGATAQPCPQKGALWVLANNMAGEGILGVGIKVNGTTDHTDKVGFVGFKGLDEGTIKFEVTEIIGAAKDQYELPEQRVFEASIKNGQSSMVELELGSWIEIAPKNGAGETVYDLTVNIVLPDGAERTLRLTKELLGKDGVYRIPKIWFGDCTITFPDLYDADWKTKQ